MGDVDAEYDSEGSVFNPAVEKRNKKAAPPRKKPTPKKYPTPSASTIAPSSNLRLRSRDNCNRKIYQEDLFIDDEGNLIDEGNDIMELASSSSSSSSSLILLKIPQTASGKKRRPTESDKQSLALDSEEDGFELDGL